MRIKIRGGTVQHGEASLCATCRHSTVIRGHRLRDEIVQCDLLSGPQDRVRFPVTYCTGYDDRRQASLREMEEIAWILRTDATRKAAGFVRSRKLEDEERYALSNEEWRDEVADRRPGRPKA